MKESVEDWHAAGEDRVCFVLDASVALSWCFDDERRPETQALLERLDYEVAVAPGIWPLEVGNALLVAERRGRLKAEQTSAFIELLSRLPIQVEHPEGLVNWGTLLALARASSLSTYDAAYLELALRTGWPLASCDARLREAAQASGLAVVP